MPPERCPKCNRYLKANILCGRCGYDANAEKPTEEKPTETKVEKTTEEKKPITKGNKKTTTKKK